VRRAVAALACCLSLAAQAFDLQGHRGARGLAPENTLPAFAAALSIGVTTLELDVGVTRDGIVAVHHDRALNPDIARGPDGRWLEQRGPAIHSLSYAELQRFVQQLLQVLDEFDLALMAAEREPDFRSFRKGVELVYAKLAETLRSEGLERIEAEGVAFDPNEHEALMQTGEGDGEPHVAEVFRQGYRLRGTVIRPASVRVERRGSGG